MEKIAIIGLSCLFPGADSPEAFWRNLRDGVDAREEGGPEIFPPAEDVQNGANGSAHHIYCTRGGFIRGFRFDPRGYHLPASALEPLDQVFKWSLQTARAALEDSGYAGSPLLARTGLVMGNYCFPTAASNEIFLPFWQAAVQQGLKQAGLPVPKLPDIPARGPAAANAAVGGMPALVTAQALGLGGVRFALDAACSSALYSIKLASDYLTSGASDLMLAGGVCAADPVLMHLSFSDLQAYPKNGFSQPFDRRSTGILTGQGAGFVALRRLSDALRDGNRIYAVIDGVGLSNDGSGRHLLVPNPNGQREAYAQAYARSGVSPREIGYVECHATGTPLGDATEINSLEDFFSPQQHIPLIGSVKANTAHLLTVAGLTSLLKVILALREGVIPATLGVDQSIESARGTFGAKQVVTENRSWSGPRRAAVSGFGFGGTNAHLIVSAVEASPTADPSHSPAAKVPMAIVGLGCHYGRLENVTAFEAAIYGGEPLDADLPEPRWRGFEKVPAIRGALKLPAEEKPSGAFTSEFEFDAIFNRIPPIELKHFNPQQLLMLKAANEAIADAGFTRGSSKSGAEKARYVAVVIAMEIEPSIHGHRARHGLVSDLSRWLDQKVSPDVLARIQQVCRDSIHDEIQPNEVLSYIANIVASRIASLWDFRGPAFTLFSDRTATARALEVAALLLQDPAVEAVVVGAVDLAGGCEHLYAQQLAGVKSIYPADGAGAVVLVRAADAAAAQRSSYAVIESIAISEGSEISAERIAATCSEALEQAGRKIDAVEHVEINGPPVAPATEILLEGLAASLPLASSADADDRRVALTQSAMTLGEAGHASLMASLLTCALALQHRYFPPGMSPEISAGLRPKLKERRVFSAQEKALPWIAGKKQEPRVSFIAATGLRGTIAGIVLTDTGKRPVRPPLAWRAADGPWLLPVTASSPDQLLARIKALQSRLTGGEAASVVADALEQSQQSPNQTWRAVFVGQDLDSLRSELASGAKDLPARIVNREDWSTPVGSFFTPQPIGPQGKVAFVYPGAFNSYLGLGQEFFRLFPRLQDGFEAKIAEPSAKFRDQQLYPRSLDPIPRANLMTLESALLADIPAMLATGTTFSVLFTEMLREVFGLQPHGAFGHSLGESSMLFALGAWDPASRDDVKLKRTRLFQDRLCGRKLAVREAWNIPPQVPDDAVWSTLVLLAPVEQIEPHLARYPRVYITHVNTPGEMVIAGDPDQCRALIKETGVQSARAPANHVMHCSVVQSELNELADLNRYPAFGDPGVELFSSYLYGVIDEFHSDLLARNIASTLTKTVDFRRLAQTAHERGYRYFIEVGPGGTCTRWISETLKGQPHVAIGLDRRGASTASMLARLIARLVAHGLPLQLGGLAAEIRGRGKILTRAPLVVCGGEPIPNFIAEHLKELPQDLPVSPPKLRPAPAAETMSSSPFPAFPREPLHPRPPRAPLSPPIVAVPGDSIRFTPTLATAFADHWSKQVAPSTAEPAPPPPTPAATRPAAPLPPARPAPEVAPVPPIVAESPSTPLAAVAFALPVGRLPAHLTPSGIRRTFSAQALRAHQQFIEIEQAKLERILRRLEGGGPPVSAPPRHPQRELTPAEPSPRPAPAITGDGRDESMGPSGESPPSPPPRPSPAKPALFDEAKILEFATGKIARVFGPQFASIDGYTKRVRLPAPPYLFVSRVTKMDAVPHRYVASTVTTEFDVPPDAWFCLDGQVPPAVTIEAGQADLFLISYLGVDFTNKGERVYRLLDSTLSFKGRLPRAGQTLRYDIKIKSFVRNGDQLLFFFSYECYADGTLILVLENACAGFFTQKELESSPGVILNEEEKRERAAARPKAFKPLAPAVRHRLSSNELQLLTEGRVAEVFGPAFEQRGCNRSLRLPKGRLLMIDQIVSIDRKGGPWTLGEIVATKALDPEGWYFSCHFSDDPVLAGSLVAEGAVQILESYALYLGLHLCFPDAQFQPVPEMKTSVRVRGQITPRCRSLRYVVEIKEIDLLMRPRLVAEVTVYDGERAMIRVSNLGICIQEKPGTPFMPSKGGKVPHFLGRLNPSGQPALLSEFHMWHAAKGDLAIAMGPEFGIYATRRAPYIPNGDFLFVDRVMEINGERGALKPGATMVTEFDAAEDAWYFRDNGSPTMPNCILLETSLQASILLGYYLGASFLAPEEELSIRNLEGRAKVTREVDLRGKTIRHTEKLLATNSTPGSILQNFSYQLAADGEVFYEGESLFGYFSAKALANQIGLDAGRHELPWIEKNPPTTPPLRIAFADRESAGRALGESETLRLPVGRLRLVDWLDFVPDGGKYGRGYVRGYREIKPTDWYFQNHFYRDPVMPGSLGIEALITALQAYVVQQKLVENFKAPRFVLPVGAETRWRYRGQILQDNKDMYLDVHVKEIIREPQRVLITSDANLWKGGLRIYELKNLAIAVTESPNPPR